MIDIEIHFDGATKDINDNSKECKLGYGVVIFLNGEVYKEISGSPEFFGTSNMAEWVACFIALSNALEISREQQKECKILIRGDSKLVIMQINEKWKCKNDNLRVLLEECLKIKKRLANVEFRWFKREFNKHADKLSKLSL